MPHPAGARVVQRDHAVLASLALARYLTADQLGRLVFHGRGERVARRRLTRLGTSVGKLDPLVRFLRFRAPTGAPGRAWALTEAGYVIAKQLVPYTAAPGSDVGAAFLEHTLLLNDVLVDLILRSRADSDVDWFSDLPFRWLAETGECTTFDYYDRATQKTEHARIRPDATLEIGEPRRRLFLECETGSHTLVSSDPTNTGATYAKIQRYAQFLAGATGQHDQRTPYSLLCPDGFSPAVIFLVHSERRRDAVRMMVADPRKAIRIQVRAYTFAEAPEIFGALARGRPATPPPPTTAITSAQLDLIHAALSQCKGALDGDARGTYRLGSTAPPSGNGGDHYHLKRPAPALEEALALVNTLRGEPRGTTRGAPPADRAVRPGPSTARAEVRDARSAGLAHAEPPHADTQPV